MSPLVGHSVSDEYALSLHYHGTLVLCNSWPPAYCIIVSSTTDGNTESERERAIAHNLPHTHLIQSGLSTTLNVHPMTLLTLLIPLAFDFVPLHMYKSLSYPLNILAAVGIARISLLLLLHRERFAARYVAGLDKIRTCQSPCLHGWIFFVSYHNVWLSQAFEP